MGQQQQQQSWGDGKDRREQSQNDYQGDERRQPDPMKHMPGGNPQGGNPGMTTQDRKVAQEKAQQELDHKSD
jgi:hypothetical protein